MIAMEALEVFRTEHWSVQHSPEAIPGYVIVRSVHSGTTMSDLPPAACEELGFLLSSTVKAVENTVEAERVYLCLFNENFSAVHFHVFPRMSWMKKFNHDSSKLLDGGMVFSAARRDKSSPDEVRNAEPQILQAIENIRKLLAEAMLPSSRSRL